jgi:hypothetical protein
MKVSWAVYDGFTNTYDIDYLIDNNDDAGDIDEAFVYLQGI